MRSVTRLLLHVAVWAIALILHYKFTSQTQKTHNWWFLMKTFNHRRRCNQWDEWVGAFPVKMLSLSCNIWLDYNIFKCVILKQSWIFVVTRCWPQTNWCLIHDKWAWSSESLWRLARTIHPTCHLVPLGDASVWNPVPEVVDVDLCHVLGSFSTFCLSNTQRIPCCLSNWRRLVRTFRMIRAAVWHDDRFLKLGEIWQSNRWSCSEP